MAYDDKRLTDASASPARSGRPIWPRSQHRLGQHDPDRAAPGAGRLRAARPGSRRRPGDSRVEPAPASLVLRAQVEEIWTRLEQLTVGDLTPARRTAALRTLRRLEDNLLDH
jgi:hypothetical protein